MSFTGTNTSQHAEIDPLMFSVAAVWGWEILQHISRDRDAWLLSDLRLLHTRKTKLQVSWMGHKRWTSCSRWDTWWFKAQKKQNPNNSDNLSGRQSWRKTRWVFTHGASSPVWQEALRLPGVWESWCLRWHHFVVHSGLLTTAYWVRTRV